MAFFGPRLWMGLCAVALVACGGSTRDSSGLASQPEVFPDPEPPDPPRKSGSITMWSVDGAFLAFASFDDFVRKTRGQSCVLHEPRDPAEAASHRSASAGQITIAVPTMRGAQPVTLVFDKKEGDYPMGILEGFDQRADLPDSLIRIAAEGGEVAAFKTAVESAHDVEFFEPADELEIDGATRDIKVRWSPNANDEVFVSLDLSSASVSCIWSASDGAGTIPGDLVQEVYAQYQKESETAAPCTDGWCKRLWLSSARRREAVLEDRDLVVSHGVATLRRLRVL